MGGEGVLGREGLTIEGISRGRLALEEYERARVVALVIGFFPWILAYAATRVMYGIETLMEG